MLRRMIDLRGYAIQATDGAVGELADFYFDDAAWRVRYFVVDVGGWLEQHRVLIAPQSIGVADWMAQTLSTSLSREQIRSSPPTDWQEPVSRQHEIDLATHYGWDYYELALKSPVTTDELGEASPPSPVAEVRGAHLRSADEVVGYYVRGHNGVVGPLEDFLVDDEDWILRYAIVAPEPTLPDRRILLATAWIEEINWTAGHVSVDMDAEAIKEGPKYDLSTPLTRDDEESLHDYYQLPRYWA